MVWNNLFFAVDRAAFLAEEIDCTDGGALSGSGVCDLLPGGSMADEMPI